MRIGIARAARLSMLACAWGRASPRRMRCPTFARDVAPILQANCQECHRAGQVGPFPLETYEQARKRAARPRRGGRGPADAPVEAGAGVRAEAPARPVAHARRGRDPRRLGRRAGPARRRSRPAPARPFADGWALGTPDLVLEPAEDFAIPASGPDLYRCFVIPTEPAGGRLRLGRRVPAGQPPGRPPPDGLRRDRRRGPGPGRGRAGAGLLVVLGRGGRDRRRPRRLGPRQRAGAPARGGRPVAPPAGRRDPPGPLPPRRQARGRPDPDRPPLLRGSRSARPSSGRA